MDTDLFFTITPGSTEPIYRQLVDQLRRRVASGQLVAGQEIPSVRELAQALAVNPMTVSKAFGQMEAEGLVERRRGLPMVVAARHQKAMGTRTRVELLRPTLEKAAAEAHQLELPPDQVLALFKTLLQDTGDTP
ncbi:GntR family transcriptional regulator [Roseateles amylovorans]|uniref:GntR family transcriptional regulator n=1 Tax=Roseateles amylovorans TaxID=2978473 RepID=A0ABY6AZA0_9BURK|nr:GntR family transcriptional regulator [Roseateles amylovorans]UXH78247.1 GntR family transcriptional regulator [Roseateles amylovorans]